MTGNLTWDKDGKDWPNREVSRFVETNGLRWHVQIMGQGPVLLLLHGTGASTHSMRALAPLLAKHFTVVVPDLPGHAFTRALPGSVQPDVSLPGMASATSNLLAALHLVPQVVVGHSAGAAVLVRMCLDAAIDPKLVIGINAALMPFGGVAGQIFSPLAKMLALNPLVPRLFAWTATSRATAERLIAETGSRLEPAGIDFYWKLVQDPVHVAGSLAMMAQWDLSPMPRDLPRLKQKLVLLAGANDRTIRPDDAFAVRNLVPGARVITLRGLGHLAHEERPEDVARLIVELAGAAQAAEAVPN